MPSPSHRTSVIVFDLDGTLVDTMPLLAALAADIMSRCYGVSPDDASRQYLATSGRRFADQLAVMYPYDARNPIAAAEFENRKPLATADARPSARTLDTLATLRAAGCRLAISSNNGQDLVERCVADCAGLFDAVLGARSGLMKGPRHFRELRRRLNCTAADMTFVGDSLFDATVAAESNVAFVARIGTFAEPDFRRLNQRIPCITELAQLPDLLLTHPAHHEDRVWRLRRSWSSRPEPG
jgi:phosphoglycolate phosphatase-like HAD superfamily hydrolase